MEVEEEKPGVKHPWEYGILRNISSYAFHEVHQVLFHAYENLVPDEVTVVNNQYTSVE